MTRAPIATLREVPPMKRGFSLVELLVVMAIIVILLGLTGRAVRSLTEANDIAQGGQLVADQVNLARQFASAHNCTVEVRLFKLGDTIAGYGAVQLWRSVSQAATAAGTVGYVASMAPVNKVAKLAQAVAISENTTLSQFLAALPPAAQMTEAGIMRGYKYVAFQVKPDGAILPVYNGTGANAAPGGNAAAAAGSIMSAVYLTVTPVRFAGPSLPSPLPSNYVTIQANPYTGTAMIYVP